MQIICKYTACLIICNNKHIVVSLCKNLFYKKEWIKNIGIILQEEENEIKTQTNLNKLKIWSFVRNNEFVALVLPFKRKENEDKINAHKICTQFTNESSNIPLIFLLYKRAHQKYFYAVASFYCREIPSWGLFRHSARGGFNHGGPLHQPCCPFDEAWVVYHKPKGP